MDTDALMKMVADIAATSDEQHREQIIEMWIASQVAEVVRFTGIMGTHYISDPDIRVEIEQWIEGHHKRFAFQMGQVMQLLLRQELLGTSDKGK